MSFLETFRSALASMRSNAMRTVLTLLGMIIGVFAIIVAVTAVQVIDVYFKESLQVLGSSTFSVSKPPVVNIGGPGGRSFRNRPDITYQQVQRLQRNLTVPADVSLRAWFDRGAVRYQDRETEPNIQLNGTDEHFLGNYGYDLAEGRFFTSEDVQFARSYVVLGHESAELLFPNETPVGKQVRFEGNRYEVIGVLAPRGSFLGWSQDNLMVTPVTRGFVNYGRSNRDIGMVSIRVPQDELMPVAMDETIGQMRAIRQVPPEEANNFEVSTNDSMRSTLDSFTATLTIGGLLIGAIALLASGVGIMNIMLVSVTERTREIGVRKAVGARRRDIMRQFLTEAFLLCLFGGILGILLGALAGNGVAFYFGISAVFPVYWAIVAIVIVTLIAMGFGGYPALKASRLDPIESLRFE